MSDEVDVGQILEVRPILLSFPYADEPLESPLSLELKPWSIQPTHLFVPEKKEQA